MSVLDTLGHCLEASTAINQPCSVVEQIQKQGRGPKFIALLRCLPLPARQRIISVAQNGTDLPFAGELAERPLGYGCESVVYRTKNGEHIVKWTHFGAGTKEKAADSKARYRQYRECFGSQVVDTSFVVAESRYGTDRIVASVQTPIDGAPFFASMTDAKPEEIKRLHEGTQAMIDRYAVYPDFYSVDNVLVDQVGDLHIVDTGTVMPVSWGLSFLPQLERHLTELDAMVRLEDAAQQLV